MNKSLDKPKKGWYNKMSKKEEGFIPHRQTMFAGSIFGLFFCYEVFFL